MRAFCGNSSTWRNTAKISGMLFLLWALDPFGAATNSDQASEALFYRVVAPVYPPPYPDLEHTTPFDDQTEIAVILINDESLANITLDKETGEIASTTKGGAAGKTNGNVRQATWPPAISIHKRIVEKIFEVPPRALFIDFGFFDDRHEKATEAFAETLKQHAVLAGKFDSYVKCRITEAQRPDFDEFAPSACGDQRPIFIPHADADASKYLKVLPQLAEAATALVSTKYIGEEFDTYNQYDLFDCDYNSPPDALPARAPSAALAMYLTSGKKQIFQAADCDAGKTPPRKSVYWSDWGSTTHGRGAYECQNLPPGWVGRILSIFRNLPAKVANSAETQFQTCPPYLTASAHDFLSDETGFAEVLRDKYVFYGGNFVMADDLIRPPTHDPIPGVYVHAMVLSNLLRGEEKSAESTFVGTILTALAIIAAAFFSAWMWQREKSESKSEGQGFWRWCRDSAPTFVKLFLLLLLVLAGYGVCLIVILVFASIAFFGFDLAPINYMGIFMFVVLHGFGQVVERVVKT